MEGEAFHDVTAFMINVKAKSKSAVAMLVLNTFMKNFLLIISRFFLLTVMLLGIFMNY